MKKTSLAVVVATLLAANAAARSATLDDRLRAMEERLNQLERRIEDQDAVIRTKDREIAELRRRTDEQRTTDEGGGWFRNTEVGGLIEVEAGHASGDGSRDESDLVTATVELGIATRVNDWVGAELVLKYEEATDNDDGNGDGSDLSVDTALVTIADPDGDWFVNAGHYTLPFGVYDSSLVSDPLTKDVGETVDSAVEFGVGRGAFSASVYVFQGDRDARIDNYGVAFGLEAGGEGTVFSARLGYLNDLGETDGLFEAIDGGPGFSTADDVPGWSAGGELTAGPVTLIAEYVGALEGFSDAAGDKPAAFSLEVALGFEAAGRPATFALAYQGTKGFDNIDPTLPERRIAGAVAVVILDGTTVSLEYRADRDYNGDDSETVTGQLAVEF